MRWPRKPHRSRVRTAFHYSIGPFAVCSLSAFFRVIVGCESFTWPIPQARRLKKRPILGYYVRELFRQSPCRVCLGRCAAVILAVCLEFGAISFFLSLPWFSLNAHNTQPTACIKQPCLIHLPTRASTVVTVVSFSLARLCGNIYWRRVVTVLPIRACSGTTRTNRLLISPNVPVFSGSLLQVQPHCFGREHSECEYQ